MNPALHKPLGITQSYFPECESIRGIAILLVVFFHTLPSQKLGTGFADANPLQSFIFAGDTGVILFFVLSGFLLSLPFFRGQALDVRKFARKRALRILPLYLVLITIGGFYREDLFGFLKALFFWDLRTSTLFPFGSVTWSLMAEVQFYLLLPLLFILWNKKTTRPLLLLILALLIASYADITHRLDIIPFDWSLGLNLRNTIFARWPSFLCGMALALFHAQLGEKIRVWCQHSKVLRSGLSDLILLGLLFTLGVVLQHVAKMGIFMAYISFFDRFVYESLLWMLVIAALLYLPLKSRLLFVNPLLYFFGLISYSLYLWHVVALHFAPTLLTKITPAFATLSDTQQTFTALIIAVLISMASYQLIERPFLKIKARKNS